MSTIAITCGLLSDCYKLEKINNCYLEIKAIFERSLKNQVNAAALRSQISETIVLFSDSSKEMIKLINYTVFVLTTLQNWYLLEKILTHPGSKHISQGNLISLLWNAIDSECIKIVELVLEHHIKTLRKRDVEAAIIYLNPELGSLRDHHFERSLRIQFIRQKLDHKDA